MWNTIILAQSAAEGSFLVQILPFILIFGVFWFLVIRPQQKQHQKHQDTLEALKKNDKVVTNGGVFGTIEKVDDKIIHLRIARDTKIKVLRSQIKGLQQQLLTSGEEQEAEEEEKKEDADTKKETKAIEESDDSAPSDDASADESESW